MDHIVHAGDVGDDEILILLETIAPVVAVRGNMDRVGLASRLPARGTLTVDGLRIVAQHVPFARGIDDSLRGADILVHGHTHRPGARHMGDVLIVNPGSPVANRRGPAGTVAILELGEGPPRARIEVIST